MEKDNRPLLIVACVAVILIASSARAASTYIQYDPGPYVSTTTPNQIWTPLMWGWNVDFAGGAGTPIVNAASANINAWRVTDTNPLIPNPRYVSEIIPNSASEALSNGWKYTATARYVTEGVAGNAGGPNQGFTVNLGSRVYHVMFDLTTGNNLRANLLDDNLHYRTRQLTTAGDGTAAFHRYELRFNPSTQLVSFYFDDILKDEWNGFPLTHDPLITWGNHDQAIANIGTMEFNQIKFEIGPFQTPGDYDGNGTVNAADYTRWKNNFGSTSTLSADGNGDRVVNAADYVYWRDRVASGGAAAVAIPEPTAFTLLSLGGTVLAFRLLRGRVRLF
jgi:hypothetical protein